jgi:hypothetical protein
MSESEKLIEIPYLYAHYAWSRINADHAAAVVEGVTYVIHPLRHRIREARNVAREGLPDRVHFEGLPMLQRQLLGVFLHQRKMAPLGIYLPNHVIAGTGHKQLSQAMYDGNTPQTLPVLAYNPEVHRSFEGEAVSRQAHSALIGLILEHFYSLRVIQEDTVQEQPDLVRYYVVSSLSLGEDQ